MACLPALKRLSHRRIQNEVSTTAWCLGGGPTHLDWRTHLPRHRPGAAGDWSGEAAKGYRAAASSLARMRANDSCDG